MDIDQVKSQFPIFRQKTPTGKDLIYLDNAATSQKPQSVIDAITNYYSKEYSTVGRGAYWPANVNTVKINQVRSKVKNFLNAQSEKEIVFTAGATDGINKIARSFLAPKLKSGDVIMISQVEHHANLIPWQELCKAYGTELLVIPVLESGHLDYEWIQKNLSDRVKLLAVSACSNVLGIKNDIKRITAMAELSRTPVLVDAAQVLSHNRVDVQEWNCDFLVFSAHKMFGPTGVGVVYGKQDLLNEMKPFNYGGGIVKEVTFMATNYQDIPHKHEAGTPNIAGVLGLGAAIEFVEQLSQNETENYLEELTNYALSSLKTINGLKIMGGEQDKTPVISFTIDGIHPHDISTFLNEEGICVRAGHHCAQPLLQRFEIPASVRVSFAIYNTKSDIDKLVMALLKTQAFFS
ncbi:MAG: SufS family cysteine desulfurase [Roseivirga sp.]|uniref:aminotransferase class V-fold PLP-dependent enzyme n=1 Tax=Roseivirga sp. TaxID=1964215 RepID=UPI001B0FE19B|nr:SufS family cysteine desulfurase [Roseivirga sp.]MBO6660022.1 SufS family cysteine desulfurase [Roseivirga sp.]MBO6907241.1 SufS family cysteine desulfurase [Roseivirga sp.]